MLPAETFEIRKSLLTTSSGLVIVFDVFIIGLTVGLIVQKITRKLKSMQCEHKAITSVEQHFSWIKGTWFEYQSGYQLS
jgi:hypothetical protein